MQSDRRTALASAGNLLVRLREYSSAADLIEASTRGQTTTAASTQRIAMLRKTQRNDGKADRAHRSARRGAALVRGAAGDRQE